MTKFKIGDRVRKVASSHLWSFNKGDELMVVGFSSSGNAWVSDGKESDTAYDSDLELISRPSEIPPATITHEGYTYNRGERVRPDWLKDGAWVVNVGTGDLRQVKEVSSGVFDLTTGTIISIRYGDHIRGQYRPHEPSDYKWGDWAMYGEEKVFVMRREKEGYISVSHPDFSNGREIVQVSELTPTHAP